MKTYKLTAAVTALVLLTGCGQAATAGPETPAATGCGENSVACEADYQADSQMTELSFQEALDQIKDGGSGVYYFGFADCPWCQEAVPVLQEEAAETDSQIYYVKTRDEDHNRLYTDEQREEIRPYIEDYMQEDDDGVLSLYVPLVINVRDGKVVAGHQGTVEGHDARERQMTEEEQDELRQTYRNLLEA